jgi:DNA-binding MarR family transcriptional regulator
MHEDDKRLVKVIVDRNDKRSRLVKLTARGEEKLSESMGLWKKAQHCFETAFGSEQASALRASLALISSAEFTQVFQKATYPARIVHSERAR